MKIDTSQVPDFLEKPTHRQVDSAKAVSYNGADASLGVNYASLIDEVLQAPAADTDALQRAQSLLESGQLESPEHIREAAENIIRFGI